MFLRCTAVAPRENEDITSYFAHEMSAVPTSLFTYFFMGNVDKSELGEEIKKNIRNIMSDYATERPPNSMPVIDGGWLLYFHTSFHSVPRNRSLQVRVRHGPHGQA